MEHALHACRDALHASSEHEDCYCDQGALRTRETIEKFKRVPPQPGQTSPLLVYFGTLLTRGKLNAFESVELSQLVISQNKKHLLDNWFKVSNAASCIAQGLLALLQQSSKTSCSTCALAYTSAHPLASGAVLLQQIPFSTNSLSLHHICVGDVTASMLICLGQQEDKLEPSEQLGDLLRQAGDADAALKCYKASGATTKVIEGMC